MSNYDFKEYKKITLVWLSNFKNFKLNDKHELIAHIINDIIDELFTKKCILDNLKLYDYFGN